MLETIGNISACIFGVITEVLILLVIAGFELDEFPKWAKILITSLYILSFIGAAGPSIYLQKEGAGRKACTVQCKQGQ